MSPAPIKLRLPTWQTIRIPAAVSAAIAAAIVAGLTGAIDRYVGDLRFRFVERAPTGTVVLVDIDAKSLSEIGVWPWPRGLHGELTSKAAALGARTIAFDVDFSTRSTDAEDAAFAEALEVTAAETLLAAFVQRESFNTQSIRPSLPIERLLQHSWPAAVNITADHDKMVRQVPFIMDLGTESLASMPAVLAGVDSEGGQYGIDYSIRAHELPRVSFVDVIRNRVAPAAIEGKTLIVGATAIELHDFFHVPVEGKISGSTLIALATETLLQNRALTYATAPPLVLIAIGILALIGFSFLRSWYVLLLLVLMAVLLEGVAFWLYAQRNLMLGTGNVQLLLVGFAAWTAAREFDLRRLLLWAARTRTDNAQSILDKVIEDGFDGVVILDEADRIVRMNALATELLGLNNTKHLTDLPGRIAEDAASSRRSFQEGEVILRRRNQLELISPTLERRIVEYSIAPILLKKIQTLEKEVATDSPFLCIAIRDVTERELAQEKIRHLALHDALTGLPNRRALELSFDKRKPEESGTALLSFDLNRFKAVNDSLGHPVGDQVLISVARRLEDLLGENCTVARVGGDEFCALLSCSAEEALQTAEEIVETVSQHFWIFDHRISIGTSIGVVHWGNGHRPFGAAMRQADIALYRAKRTGSKIVMFEPAMEGDRLARLEAERDLQAALERNEFELVYQPQVALSSGQIVGAEALLRWRHPHKGIVSPMVFVPLAEEMGLIHHLGASALQEACSEAAKWSVPIKIAVNVSPIQFETGDLVGAVTHALLHSGLEPERLELEITESTFAMESDHLNAILEELLALGVSFVLDDFGTGFSSLSYLLRFPVSKIKIDRSFVTNIPRDGQSMAILRSLKAMADGLGIGTIVEGIETREQAEVLRIIGYAGGQGYLYSKPVDGSSFRRILDCSLHPGGSRAGVLASRPHSRWEGDLVDWSHHSEPASGSTKLTGS